MALHPVLATDQDRLSIPGIAEGDGGPNDFFFLAFGKDDAPRVVSHHVHRGVERIGCRVEPSRQTTAISAKIHNRFAGNARVDRRLRHRRGNARDQSRIESIGNDIVRAEGRRRPADAEWTSSGTSSRASVANASAAAIFIASLIVLARTSRAPRKI